MVHLPIGILIFAFLQLTYNKFISSKTTVSFNLSFALFIIFISTLLSAFTGYERATSGGFQGDVLDLHKNMGFALCGFSFVLWFCYNRYKKNRYYYILFFVAILLLSYVGHLGATLTHGAEFLSLTDESENTKVAISEPLKANAFTDIILPITKSKCSSCHNESKSKGDLLLLTAEQWNKGGENGPLIDKLDKPNSLIAVRIHLPFDEKEHMPPSGKKQLTMDEFRILDWWVQNMESYDQTVESMQPNKIIIKAINNLYGEDGLTGYTKNQLALLDKSGIKYHQLDSKYKDLAIDFSNASVSKNKLRVLDAIRLNVKELDMSFAKINGNVLSELKEFKSLVRLDLDNTGVKSEDLDFLKNLKSLESLNLYNTKVDDRILETLKSLSNLKQIYIWQTGITNKVLNELKNANKDLSIDSGMNNEFSDAQLLSPTIDVQSFIFSDSLVVSISALPKNADIYYALDSDTLHKSVLIYNKPITIKKSTQLVLQSRLEGWVSSELKKEIFLKSRIKPASVKLKKKPNEKYYAKAEESLFNLTKGSELFSDGEWLGFQGEHCYVDVILSQNEELSSVSVGGLSDFGSYIFLPRGIRVEVSSDGKVYTEVANRRYNEMEAPSEKTLKNFLVSFAPINTKYIRIEILSQLQNPEWHPAPSAPSWLFIDEITLD